MVVVVAAGRGESAAADEEALSRVVVVVGGPEEVEEVAVEEGEGRTTPGPVHEPPLPVLPLHRVPADRLHVRVPHTRAVGRHTSPVQGLPLALQRPGLSRARRLHAEGPQRLKGAGGVFGGGGGGALGRKALGSLHARLLAGRHEDGADDVGVLRLGQLLKGPARRHGGRGCLRRGLRGWGHSTAQRG